MKFDPFGPWGKAFEAWQRMADDSIARASSLYAEIEKAGTKSMSQAESTIDEVARFQKESLAYSAKLGADLRKVSLEALQTAASAFVSPPTA